MLCSWIRQFNTIKMLILPKLTFRFNPNQNQASLGAKMVHSPPAVQETWDRSLGSGDLLEKGMAAHSSILAWRTPCRERPGRL